MAEFRAVLFDFDDTLVDSLPARVAAMRQAFTAAQIASPTAEEFYRTVHGGDFIAAVSDLEQSLGKDLGLLEMYRQRYWNKEPGEIRLHPGVRDLLERLSSQGTLLAVVTSKGRAVPVVNGRGGGASYEMRELQIDHFFRALIGLEDVTRLKPDPEGILMALDRLGVEPSNALYVGDAPADMAAATAAGVRSCWATWGTLPDGEMTPAPDFVTRQPAEVLDLLGFGTGAPIALS